MICLQDRKRQPCAFIPPKEILEIMASLDSAWIPVLSNPLAWCYELMKSAYGLKDAPLLWYLALHAFLNTLGLKATSHEQCLYKGLAADQTDLASLTSLHVDDTLICGEESTLDEFAKQLSAKFGKVSYQKMKFTHFGVETEYDCGNTYNIKLCQRKYLQQLKPIEINAPRGSKRTSDSPANPDEITLFRSLISAIAWLATTFPAAGACASMYQSKLPVPTIGDLRQLNGLLEQLNEVYHPLIIRGDIDYRHCLIIVASDASLGNASKYSQVGYMVGLSQPVTTVIEFPWSLMSYKSHKSKRVATSTLHSELLGQLSGLEEAIMLQSFLYELAHPALSTNELLKAAVSDLQPIWAVTDCHDLFDTLTKSTQPVLTNKSMTLFVEAVREYRREGKIASFCWTDTRDNIANVLTKLTTAGLLDITEDLIKTMRYSVWKPVHPFKTEGVLWSNEN